MTEAEHKVERNKMLREAAKALSSALPEHYGTVQFSMEAGRVLKNGVKITETVKLSD
jgi:hypothetical protein